MARIDTNGDGAIDAEEYARVDETGGFAGLDLDGNGRVDASELDAWLRVTQPRPDAPFPAATAWLAGGSAGPRGTAMPTGTAMATGTARAATATQGSGAPTTAPTAPRIPPLLVGVGFLVAGLVAGALLGRRRRRRR